MNFRRKASVQYDDFIGTIAADFSSSMIDSFTCPFFRNHPKDSDGKNIDLNKMHLRAIRAYYNEDHPNSVSVEFRMEDENGKMHDFSIEKVTLKEFFSLWKRCELLLTQQKK